MFNGLVLGNGALGEHVGKAFQLVFLVQNFQRGQQIVAVILPEHLRIAPIGKKAELTGKGFVALLQFKLQTADSSIRCAFQLRLNQFSCKVAQADHAAYALVVRCAQILLLHETVAPVVHGAILNRIGEVGNFRICRNQLTICCRCVNDQLFVSSMDVPDGCGQLLGKDCAFNGTTGGFLLVAIHAAVKGHGAQHHFGMIEEILVDRYAIFCLAHIHPFGYDVHLPFTLLQKQNIGCDSGACIGEEGVVGESNRAQQFRPLRNIAAHGGIQLVHGAFAGDECDDAARTNLVQRLGKEIVVDAEVVLVIAGIRKGIRAEGHVAHGSIEVTIREGRMFKALYGDSGIRVQLLCNASGHAVQLYTVQFAAGHAFGNHTEEIADAASGFKDIALSEIHVFQRLIDRSDDHRRSVMGVQGGSSG